MSNLVEKSLIVGFGVFSLIVLLSVINPFLNLFLQNYQDETVSLENYNNIIEKIDAGVYYIIANPQNDHHDVIEFPAYMNISISRNEIIYHYKIDDRIVTKCKSYSINFFDAIYEEYPPHNYDLLIHFELELLKVLIN